MRHRVTGQSCYCPYCGPDAPVRLLRRKKVVLNIMKCEVCDLIFRWPMDTEEEAETYYQKQFFSVNYPPQRRAPYDAELPELKARNFAGSVVDANAKIQVLRALRPGGRVLDYGCSWGFATYQLGQHGFDATGFEISRPRAQYAREKIGVKALGSFTELRALPEGSFDIIFSNHVIEHLTKVGETFDLMYRLLAPEGMMFHVLPNFTGKVAREGMWIMWIGEEHPIAPTMDFFRRNLPKHGFRQVDFGSSPFDEHLSAALLSGDNSTTFKDGDELLVVAYK
jgi:2-polyprenyl-3-methyl-5-hydroxy-6-metoxy-1,4-benzoquinol methylase